MADKPIIFSGEMVRAILDGRKTQTRRVLSRSWPVLGTSWRGKQFDAAWAGLRWGEAVSRGSYIALPWCHPNDEPTPSEECGVYRVRPPFAVGDRLWVRETWGHDGPDLDAVRRGVESDGPSCGPYYMADGNWFDNHTVKKLSPIHMSRWASRITLTVTDVRVERVQDISEEDASAEGVTRGFSGGAWGEEGLIEDFAALWDSINEKRGFGWDPNPWVVALTFEPAGLRRGAQILGRE